MLAYAVTHRTREIGVRMALGADRWSILSGVVFEGLRLVVIGIALGLAGAWFASRSLATMLVGVSQTDPLTYTAVAVVFTAVAVAASLIPARRAVQVDPIRALRHD